MSGDASLEMTSINWPRVVSTMYCRVLSACQKRQIFRAMKNNPGVT